MIERERVEKRIAELEAARDKFIHQAQEQLAAYNAAIGELQMLLEPGETGETDGEGGGP